LLPVVAVIISKRELGGEKKRRKSERKRKKKMIVAPLNPRFQFIKFSNAGQGPIYLLSFKNKLCNLQFDSIIRASVIVGSNNLASKIQRASCGKMERSFFIFSSIKNAKQYWVALVKVAMTNKRYKHVPQHHGHINFSILKLSFVAFFFLRPSNQSARSQVPCRCRYNIDHQYLLIISAYRSRYFKTCGHFA
jgi:hypothetical protein